MADYQQVNAVNAPTPYTFAPVASVVVPAGTPVAMSRTLPGQAQLASATPGATRIALCAGLAIRGGDVGDTLLVQYAGVVELSEVQWNGVIDGGSSTGLTPGDAYFLSPTGGLITTTEPSGFNFVTPIGIALTSTQLLLQLTLPVTT